MSAARDAGDASESDASDDADRSRDGIFDGCRAPRNPRLRPTTAGTRSTDRPAGDPRAETATVARGQHALASIVNEHDAPSATRGDD